MTDQEKPWATWWQNCGSTCKKLSYQYNAGHNINLNVSCLTTEFSNLKNIDHELAHELECLTIKGKEMNNEFVNYDASDISLEAYICHFQTQNIQDFWSWSRGNSNNSIETTYLTTACHFYGFDQETYLPTVLIHIFTFTELPADYASSFCCRFS